MIAFPMDKDEDIEDATSSPSPSMIYRNLSYVVRCEPRAQFSITMLRD